MERMTLILFAVVAAGALCATLFHALLARFASGAEAVAAARALSFRARAWWVTCAVFGVAAFAGEVGSLAVFGVSSFLLLREFITITPTRKADHHPLFLVFFVILPLQYLALWSNWYGAFMTIIPVYVFLILPARMAAAGDATRFLERAAKVQWGLMLCVYCVSHVPALARLQFDTGPQTGLRVLLFVILLVQVNDVVHEVLGRFRPVRRLVPSLTAVETWESAGAALALSAATGILVAQTIPYTAWESVRMSVLVWFMALAGRICYAAMKTERGHDGVVIISTRPTMSERMVSLCFAAPVVFHLTRHFVGRGAMELF